MRRNLDLSYIPDDPDFIPVDSEISIAKALAERGLSDPLIMIEKDK